MVSTPRAPPGRWPSTTGDGPFINVMSPITVQCGGVEARSGDVHFRSLICAQVSKEVVGANIEEGVCVRLDFVDGSVISLSLRPADYSGPEAVLIQRGFVKEIAR